MIGKILNSKIAERTRRLIGLKTGIYLKLKRFTPSPSEELRTATILKHYKIDCVLDVGANTGQFAEALYDFGYKNKVISFEPVKACHDVLKNRSKKNKNWTIAERCAIGEKDDMATINISDNTVFSSLLTIKDWHSTQKKESKITKTEEVKLFKLDSVLPNYIDFSENKRILLKIDTQGYEKQVLDGAKELLKNVVGIKIEIPLIPIYNNVGLSFYETIDFLKNHGFQPFSFNNEGVNLKTGRVNTIDGIFFRE